MARLTRTQNLPGSLPGAPFGVKCGLQDHSSRLLINHCSTAPRGTTGRMQSALGIDGAQPLVDQSDRYTRVAPTQCQRPFSRGPGGGPLGAVHRAGQSDDNFDGGPLVNLRSDLGGIGHGCGVARDGA